VTVDRDKAEALDQFRGLREQEKEGSFIRSVKVEKLVIVSDDVTAIWAWELDTGMEDKSS
jgi:hypothetical protein